MRICLRFGASSRKAEDFGAIGLSAVRWAVDDRSVESILTEWRAVERSLATADEDDREELEARAAALRDEHHRALAAREVEASALRSVR